MASCSGCLGSSVDLRREEERLRTFESWIGPSEGAEELAADGFYFTRCGRQVQCQFCGLQVDLDLKPGQTLDGSLVRQIRQMHRVYAYDCDLLQQRPCGNIPINTFLVQPLNNKSSGLILPQDKLQVFT